jgi:hypothetical protein
MPIASLFLLVLLPPADATGDVAVAFEASLRHELGDVSVALAPDTLVTPAMWQGEHAQMHARFVAHIVWEEKDRAIIELVSLASTPAKPGVRTTRKLLFAPQDSRSERGRSIGLVVAELLRESPPSTWMGPPLSLASPPADRLSQVAIGGLFAMERIRSGNWAMGPELTYGFGLVGGLRLEASGRALFGSLDQYTEVGGGVGVAWSFLGSEHAPHALGIGIEGDGFRESLAGASDNGSNASQWNAALGAGVSGRLTAWRWLRLTGRFDMRATASGMTLTVGEDANRTTYSVSRWRPAVALGLELAL